MSIRSWNFSITQTVYNNIKQKRKYKRETCDMRMSAFRKDVCKSVYEYVWDSPCLVFWSYAFSMSFLKAPHVHAFQNILQEKKLRFQVYFWWTFKSIMCWSKKRNFAILLWIMVTGVWDVHKGFSSWHWPLFSKRRLPAIAANETSSPVSAVGQVSRAWALTHASLRSAKDGPVVIAGCYKPVEVERWLLRWPIKTFLFFFPLFWSYLFGLTLILFYFMSLLM